MTLENKNFHDAVNEFKGFLAEHGLQQPLLWAFREDVFSEKTNTYKTSFFVRLPLPNENEQIAQRHFETGKSKGFGMALTAYATCDEGLLVSFVVPTDREDSDYLMIWPNQIRYSFVQDMPLATVIRSSAKWIILKINPWYQSGNHFVYLESKKNLAVT